MENITTISTPSAQIVAASGFSSVKHSSGEWKSLAQQMLSLCHARPILQISWKSGHQFSECYNRHPPPPPPPPHTHTHTSSPTLPQPTHRHHHPPPHPPTPTPQKRKKKKRKNNRLSRWRWRSGTPLKYCFLCHIRPDNFLKISIHVFCQQAPVAPV